MQEARDGSVAPAVCACLFHQGKAVVNRCARRSGEEGRSARYIRNRGLVQNEWFAAGNRIRRTDGNGVTTTYSYDKLNRLYQTHYPAGSVYSSPQTLTFLYDQDGNLVSATGFGYTETRTYDKSDRLASTSFNYGTFIATASFTYDRDGNRATIKDSAGGMTTYNYDQLDRLKSIKDPENDVTSFFYDRDGRPNLTAEIGGIKQVSLYDKASRVTTIYTNGSSGNVQKIAYAYDNAGLRISETDTVGSTTTYSYDRARRVYQTVQGTSTTTDTWDAMGNLLQEVSPSGTFTYAYNADNEMTYANTSTGSSYLNSYDADGNRISWVNGAHGGYVTWSYDYENRLLNDGHGGVPYANNTYSPTGERTSSSVLYPSVNTTYYGYDYGAPGGAALIADYNDSHLREDRYTQSAGATTPVEQYTGGGHYAFEADALGSIRRITDSSGNTVDTYSYDSWGGTSQTGTLWNPFQYAAMPMQSTDSLYYAQARFYDPAATGGHRFLSQDPVGGGYAYAGDSPANFVDPTGRMIWEGNTGGGGGGIGSPTPSFTLDEMIGSGCPGTPLGVVQNPSSTSCTPDQLFSGSCPGSMGINGGSQVTNSPEICPDWGTVAVGIAIIAVVAFFFALVLWAAVDAGPEMLLVVVHSWIGVALVGAATIGVAMILQGLNTPCQPTS